ncbi:TolC family protein [Posidoniimonas corsicana]|nr:TolC family protein [Posidoniimonas corsicana]
MRSALLALLILWPAAQPAAAETLWDLWRTAATNNPGITATRLETQAAGSEALAAEAKLAPSASIKTGYTFRSSEPSFVGSQPQLGFSSFRLPYAQQQAANLAARVNVPLWTAGRLESSAAAAHSRQHASREAACWAEMQLRMAVADAFVRVLQADAELIAAGRLLKSSEAIASDTRQRSIQQLATDQRVLESRVLVLESQQRLVEARNSQQDSVAELNQLLGRPLDYRVELAEPYLAPLSQTRAELAELSQTTRPDILELVRMVRMHEHDAAGWKAAKKPQVTAEVGYDFEENRFQSPQGIASAGVVVDLNVFDAGQKREQSEAARCRASAMTASLRERQNEAALEVLQAWNARSQALSAEQLAAESLTLALEYHRSMQKRYEQGLVVESDLETATARLVEARTQMTYARTNRILSQIQLRFVAGLLGPAMHVVE